MVFCARALLAFACCVLVADAHMGLAGVTNAECMSECGKLGDAPGGACGMFRFARPMPRSKCARQPLACLERWRF